MKNKLFLCLAVLLTMSLTVVFAAGDQEEAAGDAGSMVNPAGVFPIVDEPVTINAYVRQHSRVQDLETNYATVEMEKKTNIHLDMEIVPDSSAGEKQKLLLASGNYPEIFLSGSFNNEHIMTYGAQQQVFQPLNDLIDKYGLEVKKAFSQLPELKSDITAPDGNIYGLPNINQCYHCSYPQKAWINKVWLDKLNLENPETTDEFYKVMKAFKEQDPNGNGKADEIPSTSNKWWPMHHVLMNAFIFDDGWKFLTVENRKVVFNANKPAWKDGLAYINMIFEEGLLDPASFTQSGSQLKKLGMNPEVAIVGASAAFHLGDLVTISDDPELSRHKDYTAMPPLTGPNGVRVTAHNSSIGGARFVITDKCKNPAAAFRLADYIYSSEGTLLLEAGPEGVTWRQAEPGEKDLVGNQALWTQISTIDVSGETHNYHWSQRAATNRSFEGYRSRWTAGQDIFSELGYEKRLYKYTKELYDGHGPDEKMGSLFIPIELIEEAAQLHTNIKSYVDQSMVRFITGDLDIEKDWDNYVKRLEALQVDRYVEIYNDAYQSKLKNQ